MSFSKDGTEQIMLFKLFFCFSFQSLTRFGRTMGRMHCDSEPLKIGTLVMSHSLIRSPVRSHRSLTRLLGTACFARAPLRSFARSLIHLLPNSWDNGISFFSNFQCVLNLSGMTMKSAHRALRHLLVCSLVHKIVNLVSKEVCEVNSSENCLFA